MQFHWLGFGLLLGVQLSVLPVFAADLETIRARGHLVVAVREGWRPLSFRDGDDRLVGLEVDIARGLAAEIFADPEAVVFTVVPNRDRLPAVLDDRVDVAIAGLTIGPLETNPITGQIEVDVGIGEMAFGVTETAPAFDRTAFEFPWRQHEIGAQMHLRQHCAADLTARVQPRGREFAEARRIDPGGVELGGKRADAIQPHFALRRQPAGLAAESGPFQSHRAGIMQQPEIAPAPAFTNFSAELLPLCVAGQLQLRLDTGGIEVGVQAGQVQARAGQVEADATRAPLSASGQLAGRAEVDQQGAEIGARAIAQHRTGEVGP